MSCKLFGCKALPSTAAIGAGACIVYESGGAALSAGVPACQSHLHLASPQVQHCSQSSMYCTQLLHAALPMWLCSPRSDN